MDLSLRIPTVYGLLAIVPLLVAAVAPPGVVAAWGAACLIIQSVLGATDDVYSHSERLAAHATRLTACLTATVVGVALARARQRRQARLVQVEAVALAAQQAILRRLPDRTAGWELAVE